MCNTIFYITDVGIWSRELEMFLPKGEGLKLFCKYPTTCIRAFLRLYSLQSGGITFRPLGKRGGNAHSRWLSVVYITDLQVRSDQSSPASAFNFKISGLKRFHPDSLNRVYEKIESFKKYKQGLRRANREKAKHLISSNLEREGDNLTATADHNVVAHMLKSIAEKNCFYFTCYISRLTKGLVMGQSPLTLSRYK